MKNYLSISLFFILSSITSLFLTFLLYVVSGSAFFTDRFALKLAFLFLLFALTFFSAIYFKSFSKAICLIIPVSITLYRPLFDYGALLNISDIFDQYTIDLYLFYVFVIFLVVTLANFKRKAFNQSENLKYYKLLIGVALLSLFWVDSVSLGIAQIFIMCVLLIAYNIFINLFNDDTNIRYFLYGLLILSVVEILITWPEFFGFTILDKLVGSEGGVVIQKGDILRAGGTASQAVLAVLLTISMPFIYSYYIFDDKVSKSKKRLVLLFCVLMIVTIAMSRFRSDVGASLFVFYLLFSKSMKRKIFRVNKFAFYFFIFVIVCLAYISLTYGVADSDTIILRDTYLGRLLSYYAGIEAFINSHFIGIGINNFLVNDTVTSILGPNSWFLTEGKTMHSEYLKALTELGFPGLILFTLFIYSFIKTKYRISTQKEIIGISYSLLSIAIVSLVGIPFNKPGILIIIGAYCAILFHKTVDAKKDIRFYLRRNPATSGSGL